jgi:hypothetical protein
MFMTIEAHSTLQSTAEANTAENQLRWLEKEPCVAPCIEAILPGTTTASQAAEDLRNSSQIADIETGSVPPNIGYITWKLRAEGSHGEAIFDNSSLTQTIRLIRLTTSHSFSLNEVTQSYGEPSHVMISAGRGPDMGSALRYSVEFVYLNYGIRLIYRGQAVGEKPTLDGEMQFGTVDFFAPSRDGLAQSAGMERESVDHALLPWQGFRDFDFYCKQIYGDEPNRCK